MPLCGFNPTMLKGLTMFAQGLYAQAQKRAGTDKISLDDAFSKEVHEMTVFLAALDEQYEELRKTYAVDDAMRQLVSWAEQHRVGNGHAPKGSES
jgi:hypothetical protein